MRIRFTLLAAALVLTAASAAAQPPNTPSGSQASQDDPTLRLKLPILTVTADKEPEDVQQAPVSATVVGQQTIEDAGIRTVSDAAAYAPNTHFNEFSARKLSNAYFRGVGASPANPGIATYIDGVPQLNTNSSNIDLIGVEQVEFIRGPQSALFGRNSLGGLINVTSARPSLSEWSGEAAAPFGNFATREVRASASGPLVNGRVGAGFAFGYAARDGYTVNDMTGNDLDFRSGVSLKGQFYWMPADGWEARVIVSGERARDGDYALGDLAALRARPNHAARDFEGRTWRDIVAPTIQLRYAGRAVDFSSTTGIVRWETSDLTDLDYSPLPLITRGNDEQDLQFTQELRVASGRGAGLPLGPGVELQWQAGMLFFTQNYEQSAVNTFSPFVLSQFLGVQVSQTSPQARLDDRGIGVYGRGTFTVRRLEATIGVRADRENRQAALDTFFTPAIAPASSIAPERTFSDVSPHFSAAYHLVPGRRLVYGSASRGFKAGGFNPAALPGSEAYDVEHSWNYEGGLKNLWFDGRLSLNAAVFYLTWDDLQVNVPNPFVPGQFYIANAAAATSKGLELELNTRLLPGCDFFGSFGYTDATFGNGSFASGVDVSGRQLANAPEYTADFGGQYSVPLTMSINAFARAEVLFRGSYAYDHASTEGQDAYSLTHVRAGIRGERLSIEAVVRNAFNTEYIPVAFPYPNLAPSGFIGESGMPRTFGVQVRVGF